MAAPRLRPLGIGEILDAAIKVYRSRARTLMKAVFIVVAPVQLVSAIVTISLPNFSTATDTNTFGETTIDSASFVGAFAAILIVTVLGFLASQLATATSLKVVSNAYLDEEVDWRSSLRFAFRRLRSLIWLFMLIGVLAGLGLLACLIPGIYLYYSWAVAVPVLLLEDKRGRKALKRSRELVKGRWWNVFGVVIVAAMLGFVVSGAFQAITLGVAVNTDNEIAKAVASAVATIAASVLVTPFAAAVNAIVYFDLRVRKEGFDLELLAHTLGVDAPIDAVAWLPDEPPAPSGEDPPFWPPPPGWRPGGAAGSPATPVAPATAPPVEPPPFWPPPPGGHPEGG
jgi:hypothetical protein